MRRSRPCRNRNMGDRSLPLHTHCAFTGRLVCRCLYGSTVRTGHGPTRSSANGGGGSAAPPASSSAAASSEYMQRARAAWRLLHHPESAALSENEPVVLWLPKLERCGPPAGSRPHTAPPAGSAASLAAAAARLEQAEAAARAAALQAATLAAAAGLPYRPPEALLRPGQAALDVGGIAQADHSELERQVQAVHRAQEARQAAASRAAAAAAAGGGAWRGLALAAGLGGASAVSLPLPAAAAATPDAGGPLSLSAATPGSSAAEGCLAGGHPMRRARSMDPGALAEAAQLAQAHSLPQPLPSSTSGGSTGARPRRASSGKPPTKPSPPSRTGRAGPGKGPRGGAKGSAAPRRTASGEKQGLGAPGAATSGAATGATLSPPQQHPNLSPFGQGYEPRGSSAATPPKAWLLSPQDIQPSLQGRLIQTFWADGGRWWPAVVLSVSPAGGSCNLYYETGDEESVDITHLVAAGEVAWLQEPPRGEGQQPPPLAGHGTAAGVQPGAANGRQQVLMQLTQQGAGLLAAALGQGQGPASGAAVSDGMQRGRADDHAAAAAAGALSVPGHPSGSFGQAGSPLRARSLTWPSEDVEGEGGLGLGGPAGSDGMAALLPLSLAPLSASLGAGPLECGSSLQLGAFRSSEALLVDTSALAADLGASPLSHLPAALDDGPTASAGAGATG